MKYEDGLIIKNWTRPKINVGYLQFFYEKDGVRYEARLPGSQIPSPAVFCRQECCKEYTKEKWARALKPYLDDARKL